VGVTSEVEVLKPHFLIAQFESDPKHDNDMFVSDFQEIAGELDVVAKYKKARFLNAVNEPILSPPLNDIITAYLIRCV